MKLYIPFLLLPVFLALSCSSSRKSSRSVMLDPVTISSASSVYRGTATMDWDITHTDITLSFDLANKSASGIARLDMHPYFYASDKIVLDAKSMEIKDVQVNGNKARVNYANDSLTIYLDRKYHRTESIQITIAYVANPYSKPTGGSKAISDDRGLYFINTDHAVPNKPVQIWTQGETQSNSHWVPTFDKPNERFTTQIQLTVPDSFTTLSNGVLANSVKGSGHMRTDTWKMDKEIQPYVMMFAIGNFTVVADKQWQGKDVNYYVEPEFAPYAREMFKNTPEMIGFFSDVTGLPYPWNKYSQVVVRDYVSGAMENTTATLFGEFINQTDREMKDRDYEDVVSHELFHQWFGDYVTAESWSNITLNESFATYGEQLWRKYKYGKAAEQQLAYDDFMTYLDQSGKNDPDLVRFHYNSREDLFDRISYQKGGTILHYLNGLMGDSAFYNAMNIYLKANSLQPAEAHNWRMAVEKATGKDWNWFFNQWYYRGGHPVLDIKYNFDDIKKEVKIIITQKQTELYQLPLMFEVVSGSNTFSDMIDIDARTLTVTYPYHGNDRPAVIPDAEHWLVGQLNDNKTEEHWLAYFKAAGAQEYITKVRALSANTTNLANSTIQNIYRLALTDKLEYVKVYALNVLQPQKNSAVQNLFKADIQFLATQDPSRHVRAAAFSVLGEWKITAAKADMYEALGDESYKVAAAALKGLSRMEKDTVYTIAKQILDTDPGGTLYYQVWDIISDKGMPEDTTLIKDGLYKASGRDKISYTASMSTYMQHTPSDKAYAVALNTVEYLILSENISVYRSAMASYLMEAGYFFKDEVSSANKKADVSKANTRLNLLRNTLLKLEAQETNEDNLDNYKLYKKNLFSSK